MSSNTSSHSDPEPLNLFYVSHLCLNRAINFRQQNYYTIRELPRSFQLTKKLLSNFTYNRLPIDWENETYSGCNFSKFGNKSTKNDNFNDSEMSSDQKVQSLEDSTVVKKDDLILFFN